MKDLPRRPHPYGMHGHEPDRKHRGIAITVTAITCGLTATACAWAILNGWIG